MAPWKAVIFGSFGAGGQRLEVGEFDGISQLQVLLQAPLDCSPVTVRKTSVTFQDQHQVYVAAFLSHLVTAETGQY